MPDPRTKSHGTQPPPTVDRGHTLPRRTTPEKSVTLRHHRLPRDANVKNLPGGLVPSQTSSPRRASSGESHGTTVRSDPQKWFDRSNQNPTAMQSHNSMEDPPFFQKETDSSNEDTRLDIPPRLGLQGAQARPTVTQSSSADDYRSVIDDLTIENKRLKEELKRYKQFGPDLLKKEKLFEIKVHGLPPHKKRELEATLRNFAANLGGSSDGPSHRKKSSKNANLYSSGGTLSKHASSSSSHSRPVDSAYASMSTGQKSSGTSLGQPSVGSRARSSERKVEHYLQEIPEGLYPGYMPPALPDKERKKLVVKKLEQLFTGKITGHNLHRNQSMPAMDTSGPSSIAAPLGTELAREAYIQQDTNRKAGRSRDNVSTSNSNSNGDQTESRGNGNGSGTGSGSGSGRGHNGSPPSELAPEQRPTRPRDLDPDRIQIPSENMDYIRHLGLAAPELLAKGKSNSQDVAPDAEGWVYLNLLCNLAQLHILNVGPDFIRKAVSEKSTKFQLSQDGRKIRWRGGTEGTKFSGESSGDNSQPNPSTDEDDGAGKPGQRKKQKTDASGGGFASTSSKNHSKLGPQISGSSGSFHYKPLFVHRTSSATTSVDGTGSQDSYQVEGSPGQNSRWDYSGSGSTPRKKRRADGAIVFYSGAPFCTDLSGDFGDTSPRTYMTSTGREQGSDSNNPHRLKPERSLSGSSIPYRPLTDRPDLLADSMDVDGEPAPELTMDDTDDVSGLDSDFPWCDDPQTVYVAPIEPILEPSGLGRVFPDDHFAVVVTTRRPCARYGVVDPKARPSMRRTRSNDTTTTIISRLESMSASSPPLKGKGKGKTRAPVIEIEYLSGRVKRMKPVPLPPPATFYPPFSSSESDADEDLLNSDEDGALGDELLRSSSEEVLSRRVNTHHSDSRYPDGEDLSSGDEEDEVDAVVVEMGDQEPEPMSRKKHRPSTAKARAPGSAKGSSVATAGGGGSGYDSSMEDD